MSHIRIFPQPDHASFSSSSSERPLSPSALQSRKRKRPIARAAADLFDAFIISDSNSQLLLHPRILIPRSILPLSYLDLYSRSAVCPPCRVFACANLSLQAALRSDSAPNSTLLIVSTDDCSQLLVVEPLAEQTYTLCRLVPWLTLSSLKSLSRGTSDLAPLGTLKTAQSDNAGHWWSQSVVEIGQAVHVGTTTGPEDRAPLAQQASTNPVADVPLGQAEGSHLNNPDLTLEKVCCDIALQYLEVLYLSKASVAYFPKGSLSRARAFANASRGLPTHQPLAPALREMVLTGTTFEKKYAAKLPASLKSLHVENDGTRTNSPTPRPRPTKSKQLRKAKPGKDGTYSTEIDYIQKWWQSDGSGSTEESDKSSLKDKLAGLRLRESLLQIILILEILALEASSPLELPRDETTSGTDAQLPVAEAIDSQLTRHKKPKNLDLTLDLLVDRLCIWQSIDFGDDTPAKSSSLPNDASNAPAQRSDQLKEFCVDVLMPFYSARLPKKVEGLAQRMGVSVKPSPHKRSDPSKRRKTDHAAPGSEIRRQLPQQRRGPMHRTASDSQGRKAALPTPPLSRSSTDTLLLQDIKRERSSTPHEDARTGRKGLSRASSISSGRAFNQREIDLTALNQYRANKDKKKPSVDQELKDAIALLKKPNRSLTAREFADAAEKRAPGGGGAKRSAKSKLGVEIGVTPRRDDRTVNMDFVKPAPLQQAHFIGASPQGPSSYPAIPASVVKDSGVKIGRTMTDVMETPSRGPSRMIDVFQRAGQSANDAGDLIPQSAVKSQAQTSPCLAKKTPAMPLSNVGDDTNRMESPEVTIETPVKQRKGNAGSIYDVLGWDNDDDELA